MADNNSKLVNLHNLSVFKTAYDNYASSTYLAKSDFLDASGIIKSAKLPSYVDDVIDVHVETQTVEDVTTISVFADNNGLKGAAIATGESGKIYLDIDSNRTYRWSGTAWVGIGADIATADKALKDGDGNIITSTYATKDLATASDVGLVKIGENINVDGAGSISVNIATATELGVVKIGDGLSVAADGTLTLALATDSEVNDLFD